MDTHNTYSASGLPRYRSIHVEFFAPTNHKGDRVRVKDLRRGDTKWLPYSYKIGDIIEQANQYLSGLGIVVDGLTLHDTTRGYTLITKNFETAIK